MGTAFQIVDDLTDFEFDLARGSHNLLVAQITHGGSAEERRRLQALGRTASGDGDVVAEQFPDSARAVIERGEAEAREALEELQALGFWLPPDLSHQLVRAIVGLDGVERMRAL
jgi:geranylgeranyl pyrophosphate synthase